MPKRNTLLPKHHGVYNDEHAIHLLSADAMGTLIRDTSTDGIDFRRNPEPITILDDNDAHLDMRRCSDLRFSTADPKQLLTYTYRPNTHAYRGVAVSYDSHVWRTVTKLPGVTEPTVIVPGPDRSFLMLYGGDGINAYSSKNLILWEPLETAIIRNAAVGNARFTVGAARPVTDGIMLAYYLSYPHNGESRYAIHSALLDSRDASHILWTPPSAVWEQTDQWHRTPMAPIGLVDTGKQLISYWESTGHILTMFHPPLIRLAEERKTGPSIGLSRAPENPILNPNSGSVWESKAVFNPAAVYEDGKVHLMYRAIGDHDRSMIGYASSKDGVTIDERLEDPVYIPTEPFEGNRPDFVAHPSDDEPATYSPFMSGGGGSGGCEDPRLTKIDDTMYMTYVAYDGWNPPRVALTSLPVSDFIRKRWAWKKPVLISPPGVVDKNCILFPEKINGKYVIFHRIFPDMLVDYVDSLDAFDGKTVFLKRHGDAVIPPRPMSWDSRKIGAGPPPIKTDAGWLIIYHSVDNRDAGRYKIGAMLLDKNDPTRVIARSRHPLLAPDMQYENEGFKAGVAYPCGAVTIGDRLLIYYGGADTVVCAAETRLSEFLQELQYNGSTTLTRARVYA